MIVRPHVRASGGWLDHGNAEAMVWGRFLNPNKLPSARHNGHIPVLDGMRGIAELVVAFYRG
jgi:hypothetical protein